VPSDLQLASQEPDLEQGEGEVIYLPPQPDPRPQDFAKLLKEEVARQAVLTLEYRCREVEKRGYDDGLLGKPLCRNLYLGPQNEILTMFYRRGFFLGRTMFNVANVLAKRPDLQKKLFQPEEPEKGVGDSSMKDEARQGQENQDQKQEEKKNQEPPKQEKKEASIGSYIIGTLVCTLVGGLAYMLGQRGGLKKGMDFRHDKE